MKSRLHAPSPAAQTETSVKSGWLKSRPMESALDTETVNLQAKSQKPAQLGYNFAQIPIFASDTPIQPKLAIGAPNDQYEQEADRVADQVMSAPAAPIQKMAGEEDELQMKPLAAAITPLMQRQAEEEELQMKPIQREAEEDELQLKPIQREAEEDELQLKPIQREAEEDELQMKPTVQRAEAESTTNSLETRLSQSRGGGSALPDETRSFMESRFGADFGGVRIHTGSEAVQMNREVQAQAFTHGSDVYFNAGKFDPSSNSGKHLLAHELTHVVQQTGAVQTKPEIMRQDAGTPTTAPPQPTDAGPIAGVPTTTPADLDSLPEDLRNFLTHGLFGPQALVPPTNIGGFDSSYNPQTGQLLIQVKTGANLNDGLAIDGAGVITANHGDLAQAAIDGMAIPDLANRQAFIADFIWNDEQKQTFMTDLQDRVEGAWSSSATGLSFTCTKPGWESVTARALVDVDVHEGAAGADDHLQTTVYKVPDSGTYNVGAFVDSDRNDPNNARDQDPHNNELVMSSTDVNPTPESQSLLRRSVRFGHDSAAIGATAQDTLRGFAADFQDANLDLTNPVQLVGHASSSGSEAYNLQLAQRRIEAVRTFLSSVGFTGINERVSTDNQGEAGAAEAPEWRRVDLIVGSGEGQLVAAHEFGHVFGLDDEYVSNDVNPGGTITGSGKAVGTAVGHDQMARDIGTSGAIAENNDGMMSLGNTIRGQHYATFGWALGQVTGVTEWQVG